MNNIYAFILGLPLLILGFYCDLKLLQGYGGRARFYKRGLILSKNPKLQDRIRLSVSATVLTLVGVYSC